MLRSLKQLYGDNLGAADGEIGRVKDFYFDDQSWAVRYLVADTGTWLTSRQVLLSPHSLGSFSRRGKVLPPMPVFEIAIRQRGAKAATPKPEKLDNIFSKSRDTREMKASHNAQMLSRTW